MRRLGIALLGDVTAAFVPRWTACRLPGTARKADDARKGQRLSGRPGWKGGPYGDRRRRYAVIGHRIRTDRA